MRILNAWNDRWASLGDDTNNWMLTGDQSSMKLHVGTDRSFSNVVDYNYAKDVRCCSVDCRIEVEPSLFITKNVDNNW